VPSWSPWQAGDVSTVTVIEPREVPLGGLRAMNVRRTLPSRGRTMVGAWCFLDHYGPDDVEDTGGMVVSAHPHTGLQTVSWLFSGEIEHRDSAGHRAIVRPGEVNLMTAGRGISHTEVSTQRHDVAARRPALGRAARLEPVGRAGFRALRGAARAR
jgi:redox-sensitive bicupin YhaK (pirin superfamily)